jgi:hypothetical protein
MAGWPFSYLFLMVASAVSARAGSIVYDFIYTATSGPFPSTTVQLIEPEFLVAGTYSITPFDISDGSVDYVFTQLAVTGSSSSPSFNFSFGTATASVSPLFLPLASAPDALFISGFVGSLPSSPLTLSASDTEVIAYQTPSSSIFAEEGLGTIELQITETPELPTATTIGLVLLAGAILGIGRRAVGRLRAG